MNWEEKVSSVKGEYSHLFSAHDSNARFCYLIFLLEASSILVETHKQRVWCSW